MELVRRTLFRLWNLLDVEELGFEHGDNLYYLLMDTDTKKYMAYGYIKKDLITSVIPNPDGFFSMEGSVKDILEKRGIKSTKWGKLLKMFMPHLTEQQLEQYIRKIKGEDISLNTFQIRDNIVKTYERTSLNSCMSGEDDCEKVRLYEKLGCKIMVQLSESGQERSRSIIWNGVTISETGESVTLCDRIYSFTDADYKKHVNHALSLGMLVRHGKNHHDNTSFLIAPEHEEELKLSYELDKHNIDIDDLNDMPWPYIDTLSTFDEKTHSFNNFGSGFECRSTAGESPYYTCGETCPHCGSEIDNEDTWATCDGERCNECSTWCSECEEYHHPSHCTEFHHSSDHICNYCLDKSNEYVAVKDSRYIYKLDDVYYCIDISDYATDATYCETDNEYYYSEASLIEINERYYLLEDDNIIKHAGAWYLKDSDEYNEAVESDKELVTCE